MVNIEEYMGSLVSKLQKVFGSRLCYVGLQGSYLRGEATENSDIDVMLILDTLSVEDMDAYREILTDLGQYALSCGFICGREEFRNWNVLELCHVLHTTKDWFGSLLDYTASYTREDVRQYTKMSLNNLYHGLCHSYIHSDKLGTYETLPGMYKGTFFILQSMHYLKTGEYIQTKQQLLSQLEGTDKIVLEMGMNPDNPALRSEESFRLLFDWVSGRIREL